MSSDSDGFSSRESYMNFFIRWLFADLCIGCAFIGVELFMWIFGVWIFFETPENRRRGRARHLVVSFAILVADCLARLPLAKYCFVLLYKPSNGLEISALAAELGQTWYNQLSSWASVVLTWISGGLLVYRCYIIWADKRFVVVLPLLIYLGMIATSIVYNSPGQSDLIAYRTMEAWNGLLVGLDILVTLLISWKLLRMRKEQAAIAANLDSKIYIGVVSILVESALPLAIVGIVRIVINANNPRLNAPFWLHHIVDTLWYICTAMAPQLIIFRVAVGRSWAEYGAVSSHQTVLAFRHPTSTGSSTDIDEEAPDSDSEKDTS